MKDLIQKIQLEIDAYRHNVHAFEMDANFKIVGSCMDFKIQFTEADSPQIQFQTTCQYIEIVCVLQRMGAIRGHDAATKQVYTKLGHAKHLWEALETVGELPFLLALLTHHLQCATNVLDYDGDAEELAYLYNDFSIIEKCAWLHRLANAKHVNNAYARSIVSNLLNFHEGHITYFPATVPPEVQFFAKWMQRNPYNLFTLCNPVEAAQPAYVTTATN